MPPEESQAVLVRPAGEVTALLLQWRRGDAVALERLLPLVYGELREIAERSMRRERAGHTLQPTAVVHEAYLKLVDASRIDYRDRAHFFGIAAHAMREVLVEHARKRQAAKRSGGTRIDLTSVTPAVLERNVDLLAVDQALQRLGRLDAAQARLVELRFFGGLTIEETAEVLDSSPTQVKRQWRAAKAWLFRELQGGGV